MSGFRSVLAGPATNRRVEGERGFSLIALAGVVALLVALLTASLLSGVRASGTTSSISTNPSLSVYSQQWQPWGPQDLGTSTSTISSQGCALTASAMLLRAYGINTNPGALNQWLISHSGYVDQDLLVWGAVASFAQAQGVSVSYTGWQSDNLSLIDNSLQAGNPVIAQVTLDGGMHFVLITGLGPDGTLWINDPWTGDHTTFQARYGDPATQIQSIRLYSGTPVAQPQLTAMSAGGAETISAPLGGLGTEAAGTGVLALPYTTPTSNWYNGTPATVGSWSDQQISFTAPATLNSGFVIVETAAGEPNYWFPYTVTGTAPVTVSSLSPSSGSGAGGTAVTIYGTGFQPPAAVSFGGTPATSVNVVSATEVQAISPAGAGSQQVQVGDWMGTSPSSTGDLFSYPLPTPPGAMTGLTPARICDTRAGNPSGLSGSATQCDGKTMSANNPLDVQVTGLGGVPATGVGAVVLNVTVTNPSSSGYLTVYPAGQPPPVASNLDFAKGQTVANLVETGVGSGGQVAVVTGGASADVVIDVAGYSAPATVSGLGLYQPLGPTRICDTRSAQPSNQCTGKTMGTNSTMSVQVTGLAGVPSGATAVALNVTATDTTQASFLTVFPAGAPPVASNLNWAAGATSGNLVIATLNPTGGLSVYNAQGSADIVIDVMGYYTAAGGTGTEFSPLPAPTRICDTRGSQPTNQCTGKTLAANSTLSVQVSGLDGVPANAKAVVVNVTATDTTAASYLTVYPSGSVPGTSNVNWTQAETVPNLVVATVSASGGFVVYNASGSADVVIDVLGWYS